MRSYIYIDFKKIITYYLINLCHIFDQSIRDRKKLLIYNVY